MKPVIIATPRLSRTIAVGTKGLTTTSLVNKLTGQKAKLGASPEFRLRISQGTWTTGTDVTLTSADFKVLQLKKDPSGCVALLRNDKHGISVEVHYTADTQVGVLRKYLVITADKKVTLERVEVDLLAVSDAYQPYTKDAITAKAPGNWSPNLGQPIYTRNCGLFFGLEFPASRNLVKNGLLQTGYLWGRQLKPGQPYRTYPSVVGAANDDAFVADAFMRYINAIRCRPFRLQIQYNSWFDYGHGINRAKFAKSVKKINDELVVKRGVKPLARYVIDDGWQDNDADWSDKVWKTNRKFDSDFKSSLATVKSVGSHLGLWLSPGCLFGARGQVAKLRKAGFEAMHDWMSMAGPRYMQALEDRMTELAGEGIDFFKLDGVFGHLNLRNFELHGEKYGIPYMPQLGLDGLNAGSRELNSPKYNELKLYYLTAGTERLMQLFDDLAKINPNIYLLISNGAYLSPWWLQHVDLVWMINAGDAAGGSNRRQQLVYRDGIYYKIFVKENTQYPLNALFNHEPKKTKTGEPEAEFRSYIYMSLSRGTGFIELYIKPFVLSQSDWDVLAEGLKWAEANSKYFIYARMHGGNPKKGEVYGYTGWNPTGGYVSIHNPSDMAKTYTFTLNRKLGVENTSATYRLSSPLPGSLKGLPRKIKGGETITVKLAPGEIRLLMFSTE